MQQQLLDWLSADPFLAYTAARELSDYDDLSPEYGRMRAAVLPYLTGSLNRGRYDSRGALAARVIYAAECGIRADEPAFESMMNSLITVARFKEGFANDATPRFVSCGITAAIVKSMVRSGWDGPAVHAAAAWLAETQHADGGWNDEGGSAGNLVSLLLAGRFSRNNGERLSSVIATACVTDALLAYADIYRSYADQAQSGAAYLVAFLGTGEAGECRGLYCNRHLYRVSYPVLSQTDIVHMLSIIRRAGMIDRPECAAAYNSVVTKLDSMGRIRCESTGFGTIHYHAGIAPSSPDRWVTLAAARVIDPGQIR